MITSLRWLSILTLLIAGAILLAHSAQPSPRDPLTLLLGLLAGVVYASHTALPDLVQRPFGGYLYVMGIPLLVVLVPALIRLLDTSFATVFRLVALSFYLGSFSWHTWTAYRVRSKQSTH